MIRRISVLGAGTMGHGIAHAAMSAGYETCLFDVSQDILERGRDAIGAIVAKSIELGKLTIEDAGIVRHRLTTATDITRALGSADFIIEAAPERIDVKLALFADIERHAPAHAIVTSNTSALSITEMAATLSNPPRVAGMHFFNPVHKMKLVEIVQRSRERARDDRGGRRGRRKDGQGNRGGAGVPWVHHDARERQPR